MSVSKQPNYRFYKSDLYQPVVLRSNLLSAFRTFCHTTVNGAR